MLKSLTKHGNSLSLVIDKPILGLIGADAETVFQVTTNGRALIFEPVTKSGVSASKLKASLSKVNKRNATALRELAK